MAKVEVGGWREVAVYVKLVFRVELVVAAAA